MIERFTEHENVIYELADHVKKGCVYSVIQLTKRVVSSKHLDIDAKAVYRCIANHVIRHANNDQFEKVGRGKYKVIVGRNDLREYVENKCASRNGVLTAIIKDAPVAILDKDAKIADLENKVNILAAAFCSVGRKLQESTDVNKILIETGLRVESVMS
jgi:hypothetical protein